MKVIQEINPFSKLNSVWDNQRMGEAISATYRRDLLSHTARRFLYSF